MREPGTIEMTELERRLVDEYQRGFPMTSRPYLDVAQILGVSENEVIDAIEHLGASGVISRIGAIFPPRSVGASTLAAMKVPQERLRDVADIVSRHAEVNHNYAREHDINLWFVIATTNTAAVASVIEQIELETGLPVLDLPMVEGFHLDLGFDLQWN